MREFRVFFYVLILTLFCCRKPYNPPATSTSASYLVVDGVINLAVDSTVIKISRTVKLTDKTATNPVLNATVTIEGEQNGSVPLFDINGNGHYFNYDIGVSPTQRYRLRIIDGSKQYLSDFVEVKQTPPIDSIGYNIQNGIINLYVNAHDATNKTRFYLWNYDENWAFHSKYGSDFVLEPSTNTIISRPASQQIFNCFASDVSSHIVLNSTEKLSKDIVYQGPITQIPLTSEKVEKRYSMLLRQYALTQDAFNFFQNIQKNTEQLGSIFDAQPSQISGNIHNVNNPSEPVVGYVVATNVQSKRIYISHDDLPGNVLPIYPYDCKEDTAKLSDVQNILINPPIDFIPTQGLYSGGSLIGYLYSNIQCTDCTIRGTRQAPYWWQ
ncbi:DUF4249 domain-containing protein [Mucilaginibacter sp. McL0603]|uniref:DUF4249 domain-containing protein n=1 Tax=Mucilaginibacter sp. McL0603 TaxID=3415670 RepID=UPI003CE6CA9A